MRVADLITELQTMIARGEIRADGEVRVLDTRTSNRHDLDGPTPYDSDRDEEGDPGDVVLCVS